MVATAVVALCIKDTENFQVSTASRVIQYTADLALLYTAHINSNTDSVVDVHKCNHGHNWMAKTAAVVVQECKYSTSPSCSVSRSSSSRCSKKSD